jgi:hypothetical protein
VLDIKGLNLITDKVNDFSFADLKYILDYHYHVNIHTVALFDKYNESALNVSFVLLSKGNAKTYKVVINFKKIGNLTISASGTVVQLSGFEILDIKDSGWESLSYLVRDFENEDEFMFCCDDIEVVSIEEVDLVVQ